MMSDFAPTVEQSSVIDFRGDRLVVVAGPGTGKTRTIVERMMKLVAGDAQRIVAFITFTRASHRDMNEQIDKALRGRLGDFNTEDIEVPRVSTLHTFAKSIVHRYAAVIERSTDFTVLVGEPGEKDLLLREVIEDLELDADERLLEGELSFYRQTRSWRADSALSNDEQLSVLQVLDDLLRFYNTFDFEGIVTAACDIVANVDLPPVFLQVDEYQDFNATDQELVRLASKAAGSQIVVVGDDAQSIYGFRQARLEGISELWNSSDWTSTSFTHCHRLPLMFFAQARPSSRGTTLVLTSLSRRTTADASGRSSAPRPSSSSKQLREIYMRPNELRTWAKASHTRIFSFCAQHRPKSAKQLMS